MFTRTWYKVLIATIGYVSDITYTNHLGAEQTITVHGEKVHCLGFNHSYAPYLGSMLKLKLDSASFSTAGVVFGTGDTLPTPDDVSISGDAITTYTAMCALNRDFKDDGLTLSALYTITNTGSDAFTIREIALFGRMSTTSSNSYRHMALLERTVLDQPVTIEPGNVGQVAYNIHISCPTE